MIFAALVIGILAGILSFVGTLLAGGTLLWAGFVYCAAGLGTVTGICVLKAAYCLGGKALTALFGAAEPDPEVG